MTLSRRVMVFRSVKTVSKKMVSAENHRLFVGLGSTVSCSGLQDAKPRKPRINVKKRRFRKFNIEGFGKLINDGIGNLLCIRLLTLL
jgi:hypothetical protein